MKDKCLSDFQITALINNSLKMSEKQTLIKHINRCPDCRFCWMEASINITSPVFFQNKCLWRDRLRKLIAFELISPKLASGIAVIAGVIFCAVLLLPLQKNVESLLDEQYAFLSTQTYLKQTKAIKKLPLPWEHAALGFAPTPVDSSQLAFAAGLLDGRHTLSYEPLPSNLVSKQNKVDQQMSYQLGRWISALWFVSQLEKKVDWNKQAVILEQFNNNFRTKNEKDSQAAKTLESLQRIDIALKEIQKAPYAHEEFQRKVMLVMIRLSPSSLD